MTALTKGEKPLFILLHGAGTGPWVWDRVREQLSGQGYQVETPLLPAQLSAMTPAACAQALLDELKPPNNTGVVLVCHSLAGVLAAELAWRLGDRLHTGILVGAVVPRAGKSFARTLGLLPSLLLPILFRRAPDGLRPSDAMLRRGLCNDLSEEDTQLLLSRYSPELPGLFLQPAERSIDTGNWAYLRLMQDAEVPPKQQQRMALSVPDVTMVDFDSGHMPMLSRPAQMVQLVLSLLADRRLRNIEFN